MALNEIVYLPNPSTSKSIGAAPAGTGTTTVYTVGAGEVKKASSFTITLAMVPTTVADSISATLKIGTANFTVTLNTSGSDGSDPDATTPVSRIYSCDAMGYKGSFLQVADTITFIVSSTGAPSLIKSAVGISLDEYTA